MKTIRTVTQRIERIERNESVAFEPEFKIGDYVRVYYGQHEGHCFWVKDIRWNHDVEDFEFLYDGFMGGWYKANQLEIMR